MLLYVLTVNKFLLKCASKIGAKDFIEDKSEYAEIGFGTTFSQLRLVGTYQAK